MRHPTEGLLRQLLDEPDAVADSDRRHLAGCPQCLARLAVVRADAVRVGAVLTAGAGPGQAPAGVADVADVADVDAAWVRLAEAVDREGPRSRPVTGPSAARRGRAVLRRPVVAVLAVAVVVSGASAAAANDWFQIFRTERIAPVQLSSAALNAMPDLEAYGDVAVTGDGDVHSAPDAASAKAQTGLDVPQVTALPRGVGGAPAYQVVGKVSATFTFSAERTARAAATGGKPLPPMPPGLDGTRVRLVAGPGLAEVWSQSSGIPSLVVARAVAPSAFSSGVPFETVRAYLLSVPGLPAEVATALRTFNPDGSALPLPVVADYLTSSSAPVNGVTATVLASRDRTIAAAVWVDRGVVTAVAGPLDSDEVLTIARNLR